MPPRWLHNAAAHARLHRAPQARRGRRLAVLRQLPHRGLLHRLPRRPRPPAQHPPERLPQHARRRGAHGAAEVHELPPRAELLPRLPPAGRRRAVEPPRRQGQRALPPAARASGAIRRASPGTTRFEAERNLNACVSCHTERDCVACHGALGVGGGFDPHKGGFLGGCARQFRRNPRPCYVCHEPTDPHLAAVPMRAFSGGRTGRGHGRGRGRGARNAGGASKQPCAPRAPGDMNLSLANS